MFSCSVYHLLFCQTSPPYVAFRRRPRVTDRAGACIGEVPVHAFPALERLNLFGTGVATGILLAALATSRCAVTLRALNACTGCDEELGGYAAAVEERYAPLAALVGLDELSIYMASQVGIPVFRFGCTKKAGLIALTSLSPSLPPPSPFPLSCAMFCPGRFRSRRWRPS